MMVEPLWTLGKGADWIQIILSVEEGIEIYQRRLASGQYSSEEVIALRGALSLCFYRKAIIGIAKRRPAQVLSNFLRAVKLSPTMVMRFSMPHRIRQSYCIRTWKLGERRLQASEQFSIPT